MNKGEVVGGEYHKPGKKEDIGEIVGEGKKEDIDSEKVKEENGEEKVDSEEKLEEGEENKKKEEETLEEGEEKVEEETTEEGAEKPKEESTEESTASEGDTEGKTDEELEATQGNKNEENVEGEDDKAVESEESVNSDDNQVSDNMGDSTNEKENQTPQNNEAPTIQTPNVDASANAGNGQSVGTQMQDAGVSTGTNTATTPQQGNNYVIEKGKLDLNNDEEKAKIFDSYTSTNKNDKGIVIDSDKFKKMFKEYDPLNTDPIHEQSSKLAQEMYEKEIKTSPTKKVVLTAGGAGSGKSEVLIGGIQKDSESLIYDGTGANFEKMIKNYDLAKQEGKDVSIEAIAIDFAKAVEFNNLRDRKLPLEVLKQTHKGFIDSMIKIATERSDIDLKVQLNRGKGLSPEVIEKDEILKFLNSMKKKIDNDGK